MDKQQIQDSTQTVTTLAEDLLHRLNIQSTVSVDVDETDAFRVHIETEETGLLIGYHGRTLESFQILLSMVVSKALGSWVKVYVNVGDYREKREESLMYMAQRAADRVVETGRPVELAHLSPSERRVVHLTLSGDDRVATESQGEGERRVLVVKPK
jgi:spoIIIJ-associated protein